MQERDGISRRHFARASTALAACGWGLASGAPPETGAIPMLKLRPAEVAVETRTSLVNAIAFTPDGRTLAIVGRSWPEVVGGVREEVVKLFDLATLGERLAFRAAEKHTPKERAMVDCLAVSPDGRSIATGDCHMLSLWDTETMRKSPSFREQIGTVRAVAFAPIGTTLGVSVFGQDPRLYDPTTGQQKVVLRGHRGYGTSRVGFIRAVMFSPGGQAVATGGDDQTVRLWDAATGRLIWTAEAPSIICSLAFTPDGKTIAAGLDSTAPTKDDCSTRLYDAADGREKAVLPCPGTQVCAVAFRPDGRAMVSLGRYGRLMLWDAATGKELANFWRPPLIPGCLALAPDGKTIALGGYYGDGRIGVITLLETDGEGFRLREPAP